MMQLVEHLDEIRINAVEWIALEKSNEAGDSARGKTKAIQYLGKLLSLMDSEIERDQYIGMVAKIFKITKTVLKNQVNEILEAKISKDSENNQAAKLPEKLRKDFEEYSFYEEDHCYFFPNGKYFEKGSNFIIEPLFHIYGKNNNKRLIKIIGNKGKSSVIDLPSKAAVSLQLFQEYLFNEGNYLFEGNRAQFLRVLRKIGENFPRCNEIQTLGWQREGFYAFSNGIFGKEWTAISEMGIVEFEGVKYFLPAFSSVYSNVREEDDSYENDRFFRYQNDSQVRFSEWSKQMVKVFAENGNMAVAFYVASLFRDIIYARFKYFPHLFLFGEKGSGKSFLAWRLNNVFFHGQPGFNLNSGTNVGFFRKLAKTKNSLAWFDEYSDQIDIKRLQSLKAAYDGLGHEKGVMSRDNRTETTKVNSAIVISGQYLPSADDNALFTRSILLKFAQRGEDNPFTNKEIEASNKFEKVWEPEGLSKVVTDVLQVRPQFEKHFSAEESKVRENLRKDLPDDVETRILNNYSIPLAAVKTLEKDLNFPFQYQDFYKQCLEMIIDQSQQIQESEGLSTYWQMIDFLASQGLIKQGEDFIYQQKDRVRVLNGRTGTEEKVFKKTMVLEIQFSKIYGLYMQYHRAQFGVPGLQLQSLKHYLKTNRAFIGVTKDTVFEFKKTSAYAFDMNKLPINLMKMEKPVGPSPAEPDEDDDLPF